jgi:Fe-S cluster biogenesis protein NfuA
MTNGPMDDPGAEGAAIDRLLDELRASTPPWIWARIEELVARMMRLERVGLERLLGILTGGAPLGEELRGRSCADELAAGLLLLHGLHPLSTRERIEQALVSVRPYLSSHAGGVELVDLDGPTVRLRLIGRCQGCPSSRTTVSTAIEQAIFQAAPEVSEVLVEGLPGPAAGP